MSEPTFYKFNAVSSLANGSISGTYATLLSALPKDTVAIIITTTLDGAVMVSLDGGVTDHIPIPKSLANSGQVVIPIAPPGGQSFHGGGVVKVKTIESLTTGSIFITPQVKA